ncbi:Fibrinogen-like protein A,Ryncolin-4,Angiopoietin-related protein 7,Angiopoietin-related protein 1,Ficolin-3,Ficolin-1-B,Ficolin-2,Ryncolin-1,Tenascin-R,Fibrinogen-like protein 1,Tenascin-X,Fibrinogen C domain-containing protein 1-A,Tenascin-N,Ryncolin-3,Fibrinogen C domain-containing protein 1,Ryncolin-2,Techylectin-5B,Angiopoietin-related protein 2,Microfibril-associated glycoprotein 4,Ficolin-1-A,Ficolin-1,Fibrinogen C domain-containing protein 1-B,Angiopoietin-4 [Mytilus coruscus]|uniref:Fibrinogen C-terminal domain-containing protein n=1 Tax=Mytilus coruscus TaxID=42192 RepID=A0A6J8AU86_MYTCO|nr:Fibrinogen-like protein A,Ryncolin-4,Angiopoietin-related protein 7,Angiopoietin-related protein 1,Ficolin-3,Ficolin-1-B,Ficolin-2,Ryncolin-1,Tenascin-R,Fibrinogen-like protein 1,Tenascin-X,Fibrinogen C domain-containing protein 1-A,Tenascin-N,Ryncolin-3,Fibrinogen C domain-containing protein 1,Ryncolin-2,Techylectin-5B,Angiopoietin-related protein 2,Microfibril-associated glycoprotein 4,Ficolin-1-A,Ficolin-1,Fibrinogen C domain-containing protein 1-B,Angiopoietin-4 [Mytilus coruscus]
MLHGCTLVLISIFLNGNARADSCENDNCSASIDIPLISKLNAPLKAELDITSLTKQLKELIQKEVKVAVSIEMKDLLENILDKKMQTAVDSLGKSYNLIMSTFMQKIEDGTAQIEESVAVLYNKTVAFDRKLTELEVNTEKKNTFMMSKQNILASDINSLTAMDNKLVGEIEQMKEKQKLTESKMSLIESKVISSTEIGNIMKDCNDVHRTMHESGVYHIYPGGTPGYKVYCDMDTDGGGWTVFQYRSGGLVSFHERRWEDYKNGFGEVSAEHWLGNERVHQLTGLGNNVLRIYLEDWDGNSSYAVFSNFSFGDESSNYTLSYGTYRGTAGNSLANNEQFATVDRDNDKYPGSCTRNSRGGPWWYRNHCGYSGLNGEYVKGGRGLKRAHGIIWEGWKGFEYSMKVSKMMIRKI